MRSTSGTVAAPGVPAERVAADVHQWFNVRRAVLANLIADHAKTQRSFYPFRKDHPQYEVAIKQMSGGGSLLALDLGSRQAAFNFLNALEIVDISNNLGDAKSMATHPCTTTHRSMPEAERLEIGLTEDRKSVV